MEDITVHVDRKYERMNRTTKGLRAKGSHLPMQCIGRYDLSHRDPDNSGSKSRLDLQRDNWYRILPESGH